MSANIGDSRSHLLSWLNETLHINAKKVEECGSGAIYCQIMDSIYLDVPISKIKFNSKSNYDHLNNFKILQQVFTKHNISKTVPVERLVKCRFQDNLEFLQWIKKYWMENKADDSSYDPEARKKDNVSAQQKPKMRPTITSTNRSTTTTRPSPVSKQSRPTSTALSGSARHPTTSTTRRPTGSIRTSPSTTGVNFNTNSKPNSNNSSSSNLSNSRQTTRQPALNPRTNSRPTSNNGRTSRPNGGLSNSSPSSFKNANATITELQNQIQNLKAQNAKLTSDLDESQDILEKLEEASRSSQIEGKFYFEKLRMIELIAQLYVDTLAGEEQNEIKEDSKDVTIDGEGKSNKKKQPLDYYNLIHQLLMEIQETLYATEEGFQRPTNEDQDVFENEIYEIDNENGVDAHEIYHDDINENQQYSINNNTDINRNHQFDHEDYQLQEFQLREEGLEQDQNQGQFEHRNYAQDHQMSVINDPDTF